MGASLHRDDRLPNNSNSILLPVTILLKTYKKLRFLFYDTKLLGERKKIKLVRRYKSPQKKQVLNYKKN